MLKTLALAWILWCFFHSLLITKTAQRLATRLAGDGVTGAYRIGYVLFSLISLAPLLWYQATLPQRDILPRNTFIIICQGILLVYAGAMFYLGGRIYDMRYFLGISQWRQARRQVEPQPLPFRADGVLQYVRHPWYSGGIALLWGLGPITDIHLLTATLLTCYFIIGTLLEEKRLHAELGEPYKAYCRRVPMLFPWKPSAARRKKAG